MAKHPNSFKETKDPSESPKRFPLTTVPGPETDAVVKGVGAVHGAILHDTTIMNHRITSLDQALTKLTINVEGVSLTVEEAAQFPVLKENARIWQEIMAGNYANHERLTYLPATVANHLARFDGRLDLYRLKSLSDIVAQHLAKHKGGLELSGLTYLSDTTAESLATHQGDLMLDGLSFLSDTAAEHLAKKPWGELSFFTVTSLSDIAAGHLSKHAGNLRLHELSSLSDIAAEHFSNHQGTLFLQSLLSLSETAIEHLARHRGTIFLPTETKDKLDNFKRK